MKCILSVLTITAVALATGSFLTLGYGVAEERADADVGKPRIVRWEYRREPMGDKSLAKAGEEGWEAFAVSPGMEKGYSNGNRDVVYLKRPKN
jgi:hypothetical protein